MLTIVFETCHNEPQINKRKNILTWRNHVKKEYVKVKQLHFIKQTWPEECIVNLALGRIDSEATMDSEATCHLVTIAFFVFDIFHHFCINVSALMAQWLSRLSLNQKVPGWRPRWIQVEISWSGIGTKSRTDLVVFMKRRSPTIKFDVTAWNQWSPFESEGSEKTIGRVCPYNIRKRMGVCRGW